MMIDAQELKIDGADSDRVDGSKLHALCLTHMSHFMLDPTAEQAALVAALLDALSRHPHRFDPGCGCDPYAQARVVWLRVIAHLEQCDDSSAVSPTGSHQVH